MAKKKSLLSKIFSFALVAVILIGVVFLVGEVFISPEPEHLTSMLNEKENVSAISGSTNDFYTIFGENTPVSIVVITESSQGLLHSTTGVVIYYNTMKESIQAMKDMKENQENSSSSVRLRGKAVYVGSEECLKLYNSIIF
ncbi:MAG: hypothetical protein PHE93_03145 [Clostridia bacterium]|nr:hypothetical protein [Clostridia bacterium]